MAALPLRTSEPKPGVPRSAVGEVDSSNGVSNFSRNHPLYLFNKVQIPWKNGFNEDRFKILRFVVAIE